MCIYAYTSETKAKSWLFFPSAHTVGFSTCDVSTVLYCLAPKKLLYFADIFFHFYTVTQTLFHQTKLCYSTVAFNKPYITPKIFMGQEKLCWQSSKNSSFIVLIDFSPLLCLLFLPLCSDHNKDFSSFYCNLSFIFTSRTVDYLFLQQCEECQRHLSVSLRAHQLLTSSLTHSASLSEAVLWLNTLLWVCVWWESI